MSKKVKATTREHRGKERIPGPRSARTQATHQGSDLSFGTRNYTALGAALVCILLGFLLLSRGSITAAPILLVLGYCVLVPYGLATGRKAPPPGE